MSEHATPKPPRPVLIANAITAGIAAAIVAAGAVLDLDPDIVGAIVAMVATIGPIVAAFYGQSKVTPLADPAVVRFDRRVPLIPDPEFMGGTVATK